MTVIGIIDLLFIKERAVTIRTIAGILQVSALLGFPRPIPDLLSHILHSDIL